MYGNDSLLVNLIKTKSYREYIKQRNKCQKTVRQAKMKYEKKLAEECKTNPKAFLDTVTPGITALKECDKTER